MLKTIVTMLCMVLCSQCLAGTIDPSVPDSKYLEYGSKFGCVVRVEGICGCGKGEEHSFHASGVAISKDWVLTAAHVVKGNLNVKVRIGDRVFPAGSVLVHEDFTDDRVGYADIALCHCPGDFGLDFYPELYEDGDEVSKVVSISGYGSTGNFSTGARHMDGRKRAGSNIISRTERDVVVCVLSDRRTQLEFLIAPGDSGGGLFIGNRLAGINSLVMAEDGKPDSDYGDESAHTRISKFLGWIREKTK
jgi:hypothetical protein